MVSTLTREAGIAPGVLRQLEWRKGVTPFLFLKSPVTPRTEGTGRAAPRTETGLSPGGTALGPEPSHGAMAKAGPGDQRPGEATWWDVVLSFLGRPAPGPPSARQRP